MAFLISGAKNSAPKVMLHPRDAVELRARAHPIDTNVGSMISWGRLVDALRLSGEIRDDEDVEAFVLTDRGIQYYVQTRGR